MFAQNILPALAIVGVAAAQTATFCSQPTITINSQADASPLASCTSVPGTIVVGPNAANVLSLDGPTTVGSVICENAGGLTSLGSTTIETINTDFTLTNLTLMSTLSFTELTSAKNIKFSALQALSSFTFPAIISKATTVVITNTFLTTLNGFNFMSVASLDINNNNRLQKFDTQITNVTTQLTIDSNGQALQVTLPNLRTVGNATFRNASLVLIPSLSSVSGAIGFYGCNFESLSAPNLTSVGGTTQGANGGGIAIVANSKLANISFPMLKSVAGAAQIANNTNLGAIDLPALSTVGGAIDLSGNFTTPTIPDLTLVAGGFNVQSQQQIDCSLFDSLSAAKSNSQVIRGKYTCITTADAKSGVGSATGSGTATGTGAAASGTSKAAAASYGVNSAAVGLSVVGGLLRMLL
ncbi:L [Glarea lozoyensis ATCC 20868]|uniref:L n=1 Tax=Glarea lozoyensis (strain ATCC 20868 / MF5171) TaxID=1116229 RepID=S3DY45_GLAL2|nr:L [Glarea lozoyensis ATCC 20868] [Glarea lozoyensis ATCC 20868]EPE36821.1 L [Glarea lozoyensis ATCC 20868] [Glarea lozoyensis ATCC 20868]